MLRISPVDVAKRFLQGFFVPSIQQLISQILTLILGEEIEGYDNFNLTANKRETGLIGLFIFCLI